MPIVEKGKGLLEENNYEAANNEFNKALEIAEKMYDSDQKKTEINQITSIASVSLNPIYVERIKPILDEAKKLTIKEINAEIDFEDNTVEKYKKIIKIMINTISEGEEVELNSFPYNLRRLIESSEEIMYILKLFRGFKIY